MHNIVDFRPGRSRFRRSTPPAEGGGQIVFFTGVRYVRDVEPPEFVPDPAPFDDEECEAADASAAAFDVATH